MKKQIETPKECEHNTLHLIIPKGFQCIKCNFIFPPQPDKGELPEDWEKIGKWDDIVNKIINAVDDEHSDHKSCGFDIGCILHSDPLRKKLEELLLSRELPPAVGVKSKCCMGGCGDVNCNHCQETKKETRNSKLLKEFTEYCEKNPEYRFFQALRNWSGADYIKFVRGTWEVDTFFFETKDDFDKTIDEE